MSDLRCSRCGSALAAGGLEGQCPHCLAALAFGGAEEGGFEAEGGVGAGDYEFIRELGRGGMGIVCAARQRSLNRTVALKWLVAGGVSSAEALERFRAEAEAAARLNHPNIVTVYEVGELEGWPFIAMEWIEGPSFEQLVHAQPLPPRRAARYLRLVTEAIVHAHAAGVVHRDLKPSNILLDPRDQPRVTDFGLAKMLDATSHLTRTGEVLGSPSYLPPEHVAGQAVGMAGDLYALGAILYQMLTTRPPFAAPTVAATLQHVLHREPVPPRWLNAEVPRDLETICLTCLRKEPGRRYASATALAADLARFESGVPIEARPVSVVERLVSWCRRKPTLAAVSAGLVLALVLGLAGVLTQWRRAERSRAEMARQLYAADVAAAAMALGEGNLGRARGLLSAHAPLVRGRSVDRVRAASTAWSGIGAWGEAAVAPEFTWRLLWGRCRGEDLGVLTEHPWVVTCVAVSPDGRWVATGSQDHLGEAGSASSLRVLELSPRPGTAAPRVAARSLACSNTLWSVAFTSDSRILVSGGVRGLRFWEVETGRWLPEYPSLAGQEVSIAGDVLVASPNHPFFDGAASEPLVRFRFGSREVHRTRIHGRHPALSPDGRRVAVLDAERNLVMYDVETEERLGTVATNQLTFRIRFSPDGRRLVTAGQATSARVWDLETWGAPPRVFRSAHNVWDATFTPDGTGLVTATSHQQLELWDARTGERRGTLSGHDNEVWAVAATPDGRYAVSGSKDRTVRLWSLAANPGATTVPSARDVPPVISPDGRRLLTGAWREGALGFEVWALEEGAGAGRGGAKSVGRVPGWACGFAPDGVRVLTVREGGGVLEWWEPGADRSVREVVLEGGEPRRMSSTSLLSGDARWWVGLDEAGEVGRWSTETGRRVGGCRSVAVWEGGWGDAAEARRGGWRVRGKALSHGGRWLALAPLGSGTTLLLDLETGSGRVLRGHRDDVAALAFSADERLLCTGSIDGTVRLWRVADGGEEAELPGHLESIEAVAFSPEGRSLVSASPGIGVTFWHLATRRELARIPHAEVGHHLRFAADGTRLVMSVTEGNLETATDRAEIWEAPYGEGSGR